MDERFVCSAGNNLCYCLLQTFRRAGIACRAANRSDLLTEPVYLHRQLRALCQRTIAATVYGGQRVDDAVDGQLKPQCPVDIGIPDTAAHSAGPLAEPGWGSGLPGVADVRQPRARGGVYAVVRCGRRLR